MGGLQGNKTLGIFTQYENTVYFVCNINKSCSHTANHLQCIPPIILLNAQHKKRLRKANGTQLSSWRILSHPTSTKPNANNTPLQTKHISRIPLTPRARHYTQYENQVRREKNIVLLDTPLTVILNLLASTNGSPLQECETHAPSLNNLVRVHQTHP